MTAKITNAITIQSLKVSSGSRPPFQYQAVRVESRKVTKETLIILQTWKP
jgi:hypothetical protein